jgi:hypothetical protein
MYVRNRTNYERFTSGAAAPEAARIPLAYGVAPAPLASSMPRQNGCNVHAPKSRSLSLLNLPLRRIAYAPDTVVLLAGALGRLGSAPLARDNQAETISRTTRCAMR